MKLKKFWFVGRARARGAPSPDLPLGEFEESTAHVLRFFLEKNKTRKQSHQDHWKLTVTLCNILLCNILLMK